MRQIQTPEELAIQLSKLGEPLQPQFYSWDLHGRPLPYETARTRYFLRFPNAVFQCQCSDRHHMIAPRVLSSGFEVEDGGLVEKGEFEFEVFVYGHYVAKKLFTRKEYYLVQCRNGIASLVQVLIRDGLSYGRVEFFANTDCIKKLIAYQKEQRFKGRFLYVHPIGLSVKT